MAGRWATNLVQKGVVACADALVAAASLARRACGRPPPAAAAEAGAEKEERQEDGEEGRAVAAAARFASEASAYKAAGFGLMYLAWGIFGWISVAYGTLLANNVGRAAAKSFTRAWGVSVAISQGTQAERVFSAVAEAFLVVTVLDALWLRTSACATCGLQYQKSLL